MVILPLNTLKSFSIIIFGLGAYLVKDILETELDILIFIKSSIYFSEISRDYFNRCNYIKASKYGAYAKGTAAGGIFCTFFVLVCVIAQVLWYQSKFNYWHDSDSSMYQEYIMGSCRRNSYNLKLSHDLDSSVTRIVISYTMCTFLLSNARQSLKTMGLL